MTFTIGKLKIEFRHLKQRWKTYCIVFGFDYDKYDAYRKHKYDFHLIITILNTDVEFTYGEWKPVLGVL